jgi:hypothetical protein
MEYTFQTEISYKPHKVTSKIFLNELKKDVSLWVLIASNLYLIYVAFIDSWSPGSVLMTYCFQSIIIGIATFFRILTVSTLSTEGLTYNGSPVEKNGWNKWKVLLFYIFHYSVFCGMSFLCIKGFSGNNINWFSVFYFSVIFGINQLFSFFYNSLFRHQSIHLGYIMLVPYRRIMPMFLSASLWGLIRTPLLLPFFLLAKTYYDTRGHIEDHLQNPISS